MNRKEILLAKNWSAGPVARSAVADTVREKHAHAIHGVVYGAQGIDAPRMFDLVSIAAWLVMREAEASQ